MTAREQIESALDTLAAVLVFADDVDRLIPREPNPFTALTCDEVEDLVTVFEAANRETTAEHLRALHAQDDDEGDQHFGMGYA